jgi:hypothetical protein
MFVELYKIHIQLKYNKQVHEGRAYNYTASKFGDILISVAVSC